MNEFYSEVWFWLIVIGIILIIIGFILYVVDRDVRWYHWTLWIVGGFFLLVGIIWAIAWGNENKAPNGYTQIDGAEQYMNAQGETFFIDGRTLANGDVPLPPNKSNGRNVVVSSVPVPSAPVSRKSCPKSCPSKATPKSISVPMSAPAFVQPMFSVPTPAPSPMFVQQVPRSTGFTNQIVTAPIVANSQSFVGY